jgi:hypothetical protein
MKYYKKFLEIGDNKYYLLKFDDELHLATETIVPLTRKILWFKKSTYMSQGFKLLEITPPILMLFQELLNADVDVVDEQFKDMTTYKKIDNKSLRKTIEDTYMRATKDMISNAQVDLDAWLDNFMKDNPNISDEDFEKVENANRKRLEDMSNTIKEHNPLNMIDLKWQTGDSAIIKKMLGENMEYLYTQKIGANYKITYLYDLDIFGTVTIYKIHCVKENIKSIETFIYNRELLQEMFAYIENHKL